MTKVVKLNSLALVLLIAACGGGGNNDEPALEIIQNVAPSAEFISPSIGLTLEFGANLDVEINASDSDGEVTSVALFVNDVLVSEDTQSPYQWVSSNTSPIAALQTLNAGEYNLKAIVTDNDGAVTELTRSVSVAEAPNEPPTIRFTSPTPSIELEYGSDLTVSVEAQDSDGEIVRVSLSINDALVSEDSEAPYQWGASNDALNDLTDGNYKLTAVAVDDENAEASISLDIVVGEESSSMIKDINTAQRFMAFAGFGASKSELEDLVDTDAATWLAEQLAMPYDSYLEAIRPRLVAQDNPETRATRTSTSRYQLELFWDKAFSGEDVLRQRMLFALSQILVANENSAKQAHREAYYLDMLGQNAFGNYEDILTDITYSPLMGRYLTYIFNRKGDPETGRLPDENYAREILQLFSIGLVELEMNGNVKLENGEAIETFNNDDIVNLARVFTGLRFDSNESGVAAHYTPMEMNDNNHSDLAKNFLSVSIPENTDGTTSIQLAINGIFEHPNVAPFISRQLIQRFTASSPQPEYVERVALAFETGEFVSDNDITFGDGERGNLSATLAAILLEPSLFDGTHDANSESIEGKVREPVLRFVHWGRAFKLNNVDSRFERRLRNTESSSSSLGQRPFGSPSVFNFYRPGYIAPGTRSAELGLTAPEFQVVNTASAIGFTNFITDYIVDNTPTDSEQNTFVPDYSDEIELADNASALTQHLSVLLTGDRMTDTSKQIIQEAMELIEIREDNEEADKLARVHLGIIMVTSDPSFTIIY